jgi:hypothetical protein
MSSHGPEGLETAASSERDEELRLARRIDWRFLLPEPDLGRVGYGGRVDGLLVDACRRFSSSFDLLEDDAGRPPPAGLDLVVLVDPARAALAEAAAALQPGGSVYVEIRGRQGGVSRCARALRRLGLVDVTMHWHLPGFEAAIEIVPLGQPGAVRNTLARRSSGGSTLLVRSLARVGGRGRVLRLVPRDVSVTARAPGSPVP